MALNLIDNSTITVNYVLIKFGRTISATSLLDENFELYVDGETQTKIDSPFRDISVLTDYNNISRSLKLYWNVVLESETDYVIKVVNLKDSSGITVPTEEITFTSAVGSATPSILTSKAIQVEEILIEDKSIRVDIETAYQIIAKNPNFYIDSVSPKSGSFYLAEDENDGRVIISFNQRPAGNFLTNTYFRCQRKKIQRTPSRWENLTGQISIHSHKAEVNIDFPSNDSTPVYYTAGKTYFEKGYKYRIIVSEDVGV